MGAKINKLVIAAMATLSTKRMLIIYPHTSATSYTTTFAHRWP
jgi:hypothetical protein